MLPHWIGSLGKPLLFTMCFPIGSGHWGNLYYLLCASPLDRVIGETPIIYYVLPHPILRRAPWDTPIIYYVLPHRIVFPGGRIAIGEPSIILYVLPHRVLRRAHCHWGNLYYLVGASPVIDVRGLAPTLIVVDAKPFLGTLGKSLLFSRCFSIIFPGERIGETSII